MSRHAARFAVAAVTLDALYTAVYWLILGRAERRTGAHPVRAYFLIIGQLAAEAAVVAHLIGYLRGKR